MNNFGNISMHKSCCSRGLSGKVQVIIAVLFYQCGNYIMAVKKGPFLDFPDYFSYDISHDISIADLGFK